MKREEQIAKSYLRTISDDVIYEPDGNNPPDFVLNQNIAVEVRRLNKNIFKGGKPRGIEEDQIRLRTALQNVLREFYSSNPMENYRVRLRHSRPIGKISNIERTLRNELSKFLTSKPPIPHHIKLSRCVSIILSRTNRKSPCIFYIGTHSDLNSCGFVADMYIENINHCIVDKTKKIADYKHNHLEWWLVLVDYLAQGVQEPEKTSVIQNIKKGTDWKKIIVIHPVTKKEILVIE